MILPSGHTDSRKWIDIMHSFPALIFEPKHANIFLEKFENVLKKLRDSGATDNHMNKKQEKPINYLDGQSD